MIEQTAYQSCWHESRICAYDFSSIFPVLALLVMTVDIVQSAGLCSETQVNLKTAYFTDGTQNENYSHLHGATKHSRVQILGCTSHLNKEVANASMEK